jgi:hypothetical protein
MERMAAIAAAMIARIMVLLSLALDYVEGEIA